MEPSVLPLSATMISAVDAMPWTGLLDQVDAVGEGLGLIQAGP